MGKPKYCWREFKEDISKAPNWFTLFRIIGFFFLLLPLWRQNNFRAAFAVFILLTMTDFIDGELARRKNMITWLGRGLDPVADKVLLVGAMFILGFFKSYPFLGALIITLESILFIIGTVAFFGGKEKFTLGANSFGKAKVILEITVIFFLFFKRLNIFLAPNDLVLFIFWAAIVSAAMSILGHLNLLKKVLPEGDTIS